MPMRKAEVGPEGEPGREHPGKMSPTAGRVPQLEGRVRDVGYVKLCMVWQRVESRRQDQVKRVGSK